MGLSSIGGSFLKNDDTIVKSSLGVPFKGSAKGIHYGDGSSKIKDYDIQDSDVDFDDEVRAQKLKNSKDSNKNNVIIYFSIIAL